MVGRIRRDPWGRVLLLVVAAILALIVLMALDTIPTSAQGVPLYAGIQAPRIGTTRDGYPIYGPVDTSALVAKSQQLLAQSQVPDPNFGGTMTQLQDCSYAVWRTTSTPTSPYIERIWRQIQNQEARARRAAGNQANVPGFSPQQKLVYWKTALLPFTTELVGIDLELWSKEAMKELSTDRFAFYKADFRSHLRGQLILPRLPDPTQAEFKIRWATGQVVLEGEIETLPEILKQGAELLPVINMTDSSVRAQVQRLMPNVLDEGWRATMGNPYLRGEQVPPPGCPPFTDAQKRQLWGAIQYVRPGQPTI